MRCRAPALIASLVAWAASAAAQPHSPPLVGVDEIVVHKAAREFVLMAQGRPIYTIHDIQLGPEPVGPKQFQGDGRTPEGHYFIDFGNSDSAYHLALHVSYPSPADVDFARAQGRDPGGAIFIHGQPDDWTGPGRVPGDWTQGCIALSNAEIEQVWQSVANGTPIDIEP